MFMPPSRRWDWIISLGDCRFLLFGILLIFALSGCQRDKGKVLEDSALEKSEWQYPVIWEVYDEKGTRILLSTEFGITEYAEISRPPRCRNPCLGVFFNNPSLLPGRCEIFL